MMSVESSPGEARSKRTLNYFFDGLFKVFSDKRNYSPKPSASNDHKLSSLATFAKLSSMSTQPRKLDALDGDDDDIDDDVDRREVHNISPIVKDTKNKGINSTEAGSYSNIEASTISSNSFTENTHHQNFFNGSLIVERNMDHQLNDSEEMSVSKKFPITVFYLYQPHVQFH